MVKYIIPPLRNCKIKVSKLTPKKCPNSKTMIPITNAEHMYLIQSIIKSFLHTKNIFEKYAKTEKTIISETKDAIAAP